MFSDAHFASAQDGSTKKDDDGAKRVFFGGERFVEGISGQAYVMLIWCFKWFLLNFFFVAKIQSYARIIIYNFEIMIRSQYRGQN